jgi:hypothetical protein
MSIFFYVLLYLIGPGKPPSPLTCARIFAAIDGTVVEFCGISAVAVLRLDMPIEGLLLGEAFGTTFC